MNALLLAPRMQKREYTWISLLRSRIPASILPIVSVGAVFLSVLFGATPAVHEGPWLFRGTENITQAVAPEAASQSGCLHRSRQIDEERGALAGFAAHTDLASVIANYRLHNRQA